jgi:UDP-N-acetylmuramate--alanine ligase
MVGGGGVGMAGLALLLSGTGRRVTACDLSAGPYASSLEARGVRLSAGHDPKHLDDAVSYVIRSSAVREANPEIAEAVHRGIPVWRRGEALARFLDGRISAAIAGTHGKTTTATFTAAIAKHAGLRPSWCIGGVSAMFASPGGIDDPGLVVVEADESDGTLARYSPDVAVLTNVDFDHMEHFADVSAFERCFAEFLSRTRGKVFYCHGDRRARELAAGFERAVPYGVDVNDGLGGSDIVRSAGGFDFRLTVHGRDAGRLFLPVPGRHNILNVLGACGAALELGVPRESLRDAVSRLSLPRRRFDLIVKAGGITVISDYAHHPSEIRALVAAAADTAPRRIVAVFQPHRYTRTLALGPDFPAAFDGVDELGLLPVYAASEEPLEGGRSDDLMGHFRKVAGSRRPAVDLLAGMADARTWLRKTWRAGDLVLIVGAGDIDRLAAWAAEELRGAFPAGAPK